MPTTTAAAFTSAASMGGLRPPHTFRFNPLKDAAHPQQQQKQQDERARLSRLLIEAEIDPNEEQVPLQVCLEILTGGEGSIVGTLGNFSVAKGKAKVGKTFFISLMAAAASSSMPVQGKIRGTLPKEKSKVLLFDTEQARAEAVETAKRIQTLSGGSSNFKAVSLRRYTPSERLNMIEHKLYNTPDLGLVIIDGIRDLVVSINDEAEATSISSKLLKWTEELNIHILCIIHENKSNEDIRGHLGTELQNKAETILQVAKSPNKGTIVVKPELCRRKGFEPFAFEIDSNGMPQIIKGWNINPSGERQIKKVSKPQDCPKETHIRVLKSAYKSFTENPKMGSLTPVLKEAWLNEGLKLSDKEAKDYITWCFENRYLDKIGSQPHTRYKLLLD